MMKTIETETFHLFSTPDKNNDKNIEKIIIFLQNKYKPGKNEKIRYIHLWGNNFRLNYFWHNPDNVYDNRLILSRFVRVKEEYGEIAIIQDETN